MPCTIKNPANINLSGMESHIQGMYDFFDQKLTFRKPPVMVFDSDPSNQSNVLSKTAYYDPDSLEIHIYSDGRHPKDMLRSIAHELIHHKQNMDGRLDVGGYNGPGYYLENDKLRKIEQEAMLHGNALMREYEDTIKKENNQMSLKEWKNNELNKLLLKKFGILNENKKEYDLEENQDRVFAPNHYCAHHVVYEGKEGHTVDHNWNEKLQKVTKYDVKFEDGSIIRNIHESKLTILEAFSEGSHSGKRDDGHPAAKRDEEDEEKMEEAAKPDFPDVDGDGDREEPISKAQQDKKEKEGDSDKKEDSNEDESDDKKEDESGDKDLSKVPPQLRDHVKGKMKEENRDKQPDSKKSKKSKYPEKDFPHDSSALKHRNESKVNMKQLIEKVLKNNKRIMEKLKDK